MAQLVKKIRTEQGDLQIDYNALANKPTVASLGAVAKGGDTMTGNLTMQSSGFVPTITMQTQEDEDGKMAIGRISKNASTTVDYGLHLRDYTHGDLESNNSTVFVISNANPLAEKIQLIHQVDSQNKYYNLYGEHNKPTLSDLGVTATATELNYCDGVTSNIQTQLNGKAASSHGTHVVWGTEAPKVAGTASVGSATTAARSDHVHPAQTAITGNAGSATKLATVRTIRTNLGSTDPVGFDGTTNIATGVTGTLQISHGGTGSTTAADARTALGAVAKTGDTMTGNLIIDTGASSAIVLQAPDNSEGKQSYSKIYKNASATTDYGLQLRDYAHGGNETNTSCMLMLCSSQGTLAKKIQFSNQVNGTTTNYTLYGEHNKPTPSDIGAAASNHNHSGGYFRSNVSTLNLAADTITGIALANIYSNDSANFSLSNGGIKCAKAGYIVVSGSVYMNNSTDSTALMGAYIYKNNTEIMAQYLPYGVSGTVSAGTRVVNVAAGDIIYLKARCSMATTVLPSDDGTVLSIAYL
jgi:hypothetical protein